MTQDPSTGVNLVPVTVIQAGPCTVVAMRNTERNGYAAAQLGLDGVEESRLSEPRRRRGKQAGGGAAVGGGDVFAPGQRVQVTGISKGRGTTGVIKRHRFSGFPASHGTHEYFRHGGSIGNRSFPGRVFKGKRMAGHYGADRVTTRNLEVVAVRPEEHV